MGGHVLWEDMSYGRTCLMGEHVLWENMSYRRTSVIQEDTVSNFLLVCVGLI